MNESIPPAAAEKPGPIPIGQDSDDYQLMVSSVRDYAIILLDESGYVVSWNPGAERFKGYKAEEIIGRHFSQFYPAAAVESGFPDEELRVAGKEGRFEDEGWRVRKDGTQFWANVIITTLRDKDGNLRGFAKLTRDLTERKAAEEAVRQARDTLEERVIERTAELLRANEELQAAKAAADAASQAKSEFLSRMSHELRTPLNAILGFSQLLGMRDWAAEDQQHLDHIIKSGSHLLALINDVLDIARVESGRIDLSIEPVRIADVVREAVDIIRPLASRNQIDLVIEDSIINHCFAMADHQRLKQVFINLLSNAVKYNHHGGSVEVTCREAEKKVTIDIIDTGIGISTENIAKLFTPFERLDATKTRIEGTGLGLAFSKSMVDAMDGQLLVDSVLGKGSTFSIELPTAQSQIAQAAEHLEPMTAESQPPLKSHTVLLIEDNFSNYQLIESIFAYRPQIKLLGAMQGSLGVEMARHNHPDLILLDIHLPDIMGSDVLGVLRASEDTAHIPIIIVSADATANQVQRLLNAGANAYLTKPLNVKEFLWVIDDMLQTQQGGNNSLP